MALEFRAPFQIQPNTKIDQLNRLNQTVTGIGNEAVAFRQQQQEKQRQDALMALQQAQDRRAQGEYQANYVDPLSGGGASQPSMVGPAPDASLQNGMTSSAPSYSPATEGPEPQGSTDYSQGQQGPQPQGYVDHTAHFNNWKQMGMPSSYDHPDYGGSGQGMPQNPMSGIDMNTFAGIPGSKRRAEYLTSNKDIAEINKLNADAHKANNPLAAGTSYTPAQASDINSGNFNPANWPGGTYPKDAVHAALAAKGQAATANRFDLTQGERSDQFAQKEWDKIVKDTDPNTAGNRNLLGRAAVATFQANRALSTLSKPMVTNQEAGNAMADIAAIYQNGSPTEFGMSHQAYNTLYGRIQGVIQSLTGKPTDAMPDAIKQRLQGVLQDMKTTNSGVVKQHLDSVERSKKKIISQFPDEWKQLRQTYEGDQSGYNGLGQENGGAMTPDVLAYAQKHGITASQALQIKMQRTQGAQ